MKDFGNFLILKVTNILLGKSYPGWRENISICQIILFCSYGEKLSHLPRKVFGCGQRNHERFPVKRESFGYVVFIWDENYLRHRDLACQQVRSRYSGELFVSYERNVTSHINFISTRDLACKLILSKCFLANRDNWTLVKYYQLPNDLSGKIGIITNIHKIICIHINIFFTVKSNYYNGRCIIWLLDK